MAEYIEREAFIAEQRHLYCENCARRKGMKNGKMRFVYEIGDAPCRACGYGDVLDDLEDYPAADVREVVKAEWELDENGMDWNIPAWVCSKCGARNDALPVIVRFPDGEKTVHNPHRFSCSNFCPNCGATMETRARWIPNVPSRDLRPRCSACGELNPTEESTCPNCGADMREES